MKPHERRLAGEGADKEGDVLLAVVASAKGDNLRRGHVVERELRARDDIDRGLRPFANHLIQRNGRVGGGRLKHPQSRKESRRASERKRRPARVHGFGRNSMERSPRRPVEVATRVGERKRRGRVEPIRALDHDGRLRIGGIALVGELQRRGAPAADHQPRAMAEVAQIERLLRGGFDGGDRQLFPAGDSQWPAGPQQCDRQASTAAQTSISQISGT